jgi:hypothetical protein
MRDSFPSIMPVNIPGHLSFNVYDQYSLLKNKKKKKKTALSHGVGL